MIGAMAFSWALNLKSRGVYAACGSAAILKFPVPMMTSLPAMAGSVRIGEENFAEQSLSVARPKCKKTKICFFNERILS